MGWRIKHVSTGGLLVMACAAALSASAGGAAAGERKLAYGYALQGHAVYAAVGATTRAPIGWLEFCVEYKQECRVKPAAARDIVLTSKAWTDLVKVNDWVNHNVKPITDLEHWGVVERWNYPDDGYGDCEDYVLLKRRMLIKAGWPRSALLVTVVRDKKGAGHAVLTVKTNRGEFVLDNQQAKVLPWEKSGYRFVKRQSQSDPNTWVALGEPYVAPSTASAR